MMVHENSLKNLVSIGSRSKEEAKAIQSKGGRAKSYKKTLANSVKRLKHGRYSKFFTKEATKLVKDKDASASKIYNFILAIQDDEIERMNLNDKMRFTQLLIYAHSQIHKPKSEINLTKQEIHITMEEQQETWTRICYETEMEAKKKVKDEKTAKQEG